MDKHPTHSHPKARHDSAALLDAVVGALPVGLSVQDSEGRLLVLNEQAALAIGDKIAHLRGNIPFGVRQAGPERIAQRRERFLKRLGGSETWLHERVVIIENEPHTLLVTGWPVEVGEERMLVSTSIDITERKRFEEELKFLAFHDQLTGLPNRTLIQKRVDAAMLDRADDEMFALAFIDLDNFKSINDYYGHMIGDELLRAVAKRIAGQTRPCDTLSRISGDEFLLLIDPLENPEQLPRLMDRIISAMKEPFLIEGHELLTSATIGASIFPLHGQTYDTLQRCADSAMYHAKSTRKGSACCFDLAMNDAMIARMSMEQRLRTAVRGRHFRTYLQPKISIKLGKIIGFEALVRWIEDDAEVMGPSEFIALATELGLIDAITHFVLDDVARYLPQFQGCFGEDISISINIAARQASDVPFMASLIDCLQAEGLTTSIILELTEDALVTERFQNQVLPRLREMGVRVSIDDFGTGFSSLSTLADITADEIKVDRTFISSIHERPRSQGILKAVESLCQALKIEVVAEGVETEEELTYLEEHTSIQLVQGYYFGKPQSIESLLETFGSGDGGMKSLSLDEFLAAIMNS